MSGFYIICVFNFVISFVLLLEALKSKVDKIARLKVFPTDGTFVRLACFQVELNDFIDAFSVKQVLIVAVARSSKFIAVHELNHANRAILLLLESQRQSLILMLKHLLFERLNMRTLCLIFSCHFGSSCFLLPSFCFSLPLNLLLMSR